MHAVLVRRLGTPHRLCRCGRDRPVERARSARRWIAGPSAGLWGLPGGYVEADEVLHAAAYREIREEPGIESEIGPVIGGRSIVEARSTNTYVVFTATCTSDTAVADGTEFSEARWFDRAELEAAEVTPVTRQPALAALLRNEGGSSAFPTNDREANRLTST